MDFVATGLILSALFLGILIVLFRYERRQGRRLNERVRGYADILVLRMTHRIHVSIRAIRRDVFRQTVHYVFHVLFSIVLKTLKMIETMLRNIIRTNKTLARTAEKENAVRNKLEEIALHKITVSLSEKEKQEYKDRALEGK